LKHEPQRALPLLEPLRADRSKYVRDSVANWLNDAAKTQPAWVRDVAARWEKESPFPETASLLSRALRSLR
jgi:3-methyladenine DNA glycosylase AlkC